MKRIWLISQIAGELGKIQKKKSFKDNFKKWKGKNGNGVNQRFLTFYTTRTPDEIFLEIEDPMSEKLLFMFY